MRVGGGRPPVDGSDLGGTGKDKGMSSCPTVKDLLLLLVFASVQLPGTV